MKVRNKCEIRNAFYNIYIIKADGEQKDKEKENKKDKERDKDKDKDREKEKERKKLPDLDKYWRVVKDDATDFTGWTYLLQYVDSEVCAIAIKCIPYIYN